jgi:hypothetical protein
MQAWRKLATQFKLLDTPEIDFIKYSSASKMTIEQFITLRVLWVSSDAADFEVKGWVSQDAVAKSNDFLSSYTDWQTYLKFVQRDSKLCPLPVPSELGTFSVPWYHQRKVREIPEAEGTEAPTNKIWWTRSKAAQARRDTQAQVPTTPTKPGQNQGNSSDMMGSVQDKFKVLSVQSPGPGTPNTPATGSSALTHMSGDSPELYPPARDEQIVNTALIDLLLAITIHHLEVKLHWTIERQKFSYKGKFNAITDGCLTRPGSDPFNQVVAIIEVKARVRRSDPEQIKIQETAQMVAWICERPGEHQRHSKVGWYRSVYLLPFET